VRFQEYYESPKFRLKTFTLREYLKWYRGRFDEDYFEEVDGFNMPSWVLRPFYQRKFDPLNRHEKRLLKEFRRKRGRFYIIGTTSDNKGDVLKHELAHALFYVSPSYKKEVIRALGLCNLTDVYRALKRYGYHEDLWTDEAHAYILDGKEVLVSYGVPQLQLRDAREKLELIYTKYCETVEERSLGAD
jgi:hypothetical protein